MNEDAVKNWIRKAESDLKIGKDEMATAEPVTDAVCFHMQQCCEKYLKAYLILHGEEVPRTHNLAALVHSCSRIASDFQKLMELHIDQLTDFAVDIRYGEEFYVPSPEETKKALVIAETVRDFVLRRFRENGFEP